MVLSAPSSEFEGGVAKDVPEEKPRRGAATHGSRYGETATRKAAENASSTLWGLISRRAGPKELLTDGESEGELRKPAWLRARIGSQRAFEKAPPLRPSRPTLRPNRLDPGEPKGELSLPLALQKAVRSTGRGTKPGSGGGKTLQKMGMGIALNRLKTSLGVSAVEIARACSAR